ncbi:MAG: helix-turn-helix domain-containing protein [Meiothermus sp.]|uniref:helix-turn-helix domain-containing protein n=1 Tax=Meiothermus sp. TaxID=1955249 RepID=UPI0025E1BBBE|nr:helix-turn-helix domain-containing protein [Meiothermus sp.]MCS7068499.1 helix-turn-helix domain-containing protein [Meiothermus sp.]MDW8480900.1 helix-turn-helix domain-containing protein [Meiothermus sp.]
MGRKLSRKAVEQALRASRGVLAEAARSLGITRQSLYRIVERHGLWGLIEELRDEIVDLAEARLFEAVERGEPWAVSLVLKTLARQRYSERFELAQTNKLEVELVEVPAWGRQEHGRKATQNPPWAASEA